MIYAKDRLPAFKKGRSTCPICAHPVIAKVGSIKIPHWAHENLDDCDRWSDGISAWHLYWQDCVKENCREVIIGEHRADIRLSTGRVIEIQNSPISPEEVVERETFYGDMIWIFNGREFRERFILEEKESQKTGNIYHKLKKWKNPRKGIVSCSKPVYIDFEEGLFEVKEFTSYDGVGDWGPYTRWTGWGVLHDRDFILFSNLFEKDWINYQPLFGMKDDGKTDSDNVSKPA